MAVRLAWRMARKLNAEGDFTVEEFEALCERYGNRCLRCGKETCSLRPTTSSRSLWVDVPC